MSGFYIFKSCSDSRINFLLWINPIAAEICEILIWKSAHLWVSVTQRINDGYVTEPKLGGEFPVQDVQSGESALLQVTLDGVNLKFSGYQNFIPLNTIKKCNYEEEVFQMDQYSEWPGVGELSDGWLLVCSPEQDVDQVVPHQFKSGMSSDIFYAVMFLIGYKVAGRKIDNNHRWWARVESRQSVYLSISIVANLCGILGQFAIANRLWCKCIDIL